MTTLGLSDKKDAKAVKGDKHGKSTSKDEDDEILKQLEKKKEENDKACVFC